MFQSLVVLGVQILDDWRMCHAFFAFSELCFRI